MTLLSALTVLGLVAAAAVVRLRHCRHQFGHPIQGYVCCLRCTRRFPIQLTAEGGWRIGKTPLAVEPPAHPPTRSA